MTEKICKFCGKKFMGRANQQYCCSECRNGTDIEWSKCPICGNRFIKKYAEQKCCSQECYLIQDKMIDEAERERTRKSRKKAFISRKKVPKGYEWLEKVNEYLRENGGVYNPKNK